MPTVELILTAPNAQAISGIRETQRAAQELNNTVDKGNQRQKGLIEDLEDSLKSLEESRRKAFSVEGIEKYNKKIAEAKRDLQEYERSGLEAKKQTDTLTQSIGKWALGLGGAAAALKILKDALKETTAGLNLFNQISAVTKQVLNDIVSGAGLSMNRIREAIAIQAELNKERERNYITNKKAKEQQILYNKYYFESADRTKPDTERLISLNKALDAHNKMIDIQIDEARRLAAIKEAAFLNAPASETAKKEWVDAQNVIDELEIDRTSGVKRLETQRTLIIQEEIDNRKKLFDDYFDFLEKRNKESDKAIADASAADLDETLKDVDHAMDLIRAKEKADAKKRKDVLKDDIVTVFDVIRARTVLAQEDIGKAIEESFDRLDTNSEKGKQLFEDIKQGAARIAGVIADITNSMAEDATRRRELFDEQIAETQRSLELEAALMEEGFASNVDRKREEVEELRKLRAKALKDEEEAIRKQRIAESIVQGINLATSVTQILKEYTKIPIIGIALAGAAIAALFALFTSAKTKSAAATKLAAGGSGTETGIITGKSHAAGGERFLSHVEVERGERWGVLNRKASDRFGKTFDHIVSSFNKGEMPVFGSPEYANNVTVNNDGSNSRLDKVIIEQRKLNKQFGSQQIQIVGGKKIITKGNKVRIVG